MSARGSFTVQEARRAAEQIGVDLGSARFDAEELRSGMEVELEHGLRDLATNVSDDDPILTAKIALAHLREIPDYYVRLRRMEQEAESGG